MDFEYQILNENEWDNTRTSLSEFGLFGSPEFLKAVANIYNIQYELCCVIYKGKPIIISAYFTDGRNIVTPNHYYYQYIWLKEDNKESWVLLEGLNFLIEELQKRYLKICLKLPVNFTDIRPFVWNNFSSVVRYTYVKNLSNLSYHENVRRILKKENSHFSFKTNEDWDLVWEHHDKDLKKFNIRKRISEKYLSYFRELKKDGNVETYNAYYNDVFVSSIIVLLDRVNKKAYLPLIGTVDGFYKEGLAIKIYDYTLSELSREGFCLVDFCGANIKSIARFKHKFNPTLESYYEVKYSKNAAVYQNIKKTLFSGIKSLLKTVS